MKSMLNSSQLSPCEAVISSLPENGIEFGYCGIQQTVTRSFTMTNSSTTQVRFSVQSQEQGLFSVNVSQGKTLSQTTIAGMMFKLYSPSVECHGMREYSETSVTQNYLETLINLLSFRRYCRQAKEGSGSVVQDGRG